MPYYVSDEARRLLLHAGTHVLLLREEAAQFFASGLPPLGRVLMQVVPSPFVPPLPSTV